MLTSETQQILRNNTKQKMTSVRKKNGNKILDKTSERLLISIKNPTPPTSRKKKNVILSNSTLDFSLFTPP